jgi:hypothetical protein
VLITWLAQPLLGQSTRERERRDCWRSVPVGDSVTVTVHCEESRRLFCSPASPLQSLDSLRATDKGRAPLFPQRAQFAPSWSCRYPLKPKSWRIDNVYSDTVWSRLLPLTSLGRTIILRSQDVPSRTRRVFRTAPLSGEQNIAFENVARVQSFPLRFVSVMAGNRLAHHARPKTIARRDGTRVR